MKKNSVQTLLIIFAVLTILSIYRLFNKPYSSLDWILFLSYFFIIITCISYSKSIFQYAKEIAFDRLISILGLEIALIVFVQGTVQIHNNNTQFEKNKVHSDSIFKTQLVHAKSLNDSLLSKLGQIQEINEKQKIAADFQLRATEKQLELSQQNLTDYLEETKANIMFASPQIFSVDTVGMKLSLWISTNFQNHGKRSASNISIRHALLERNGTIKKFLNFDMPFLNINTPKNLNFPVEIWNDDFEYFYYWIQILYLDEKTNKRYNDSYYFLHSKSAKGYLFYDATQEDRVNLRKAIDKMLNDKGLTLTNN